MCDYSLAGLPSRLAVEGEQLVVHRFPTGTLGMASPCLSRWSAKQTPTVCIPPGARLLLRDIPKDLQQQFSVRGTEPGQAEVCVSQRTSSHESSFCFQHLFIGSCHRPGYLQFS
jgi:hypothetical protein